jgi:myo-inositol-1(or 4)-monophosphatase
MSDLSKEQEFFKTIVPKVRALTTSYSDEVEVTVNKSLASDFATEVDVAVENLIVAELNKIFPDDQILAEEGYSDVKIPDTRIWVIDPICGTNNLSRNMVNYCTNIALVEGKQVIASIVIDHSQDEYFWSVGGGKVYINDELIKETRDDRGVAVDVDLGSVPKVSADLRERYVRTLDNLLINTEYMLLSLNSSLNIVYVAVGKTDGLIWMLQHPWDICAGAFLIQQSGKIITDLDGNPWTVDTVGVIVTRNQEIHKVLLDAYAASA